MVLCGLAINLPSNCEIMLSCTVRKENQCKLYCRMAGTAIYFKLKDKVIDGTPCNRETTDICVDGKCMVSAEVYR